MSRQKELIPAEICSGNRAIMAKLDAASWFEQAEYQEVRVLAADGWTGHGVDATLVRYYMPLDCEVQGVTDYARKSRTGVTFRVDEQAAMAWIRINRPHLIAAVLPCPQLDSAEWLPGRRFAVANRSR